MNTSGQQSVDRTSAQNTFYSNVAGSLMSVRSEHACPQADICINQSGLRW